MDVETREELSRCVLKESDSPAAEVYHNSRQRRPGLERYRRLIEPLSGAVSLPASPYSNATMVMAIAAKELVGKELPTWGWIAMS